MGLLDRAAIATLPLVPRPLMRVIAMRYIAGEELGDAITKLVELKAQGFKGILDLLGEDVTTEEAAREVSASYRDAATRLVEQDLDAYVSIKPTHLGLRRSEDLCHELFAEVAAHCRDQETFVRVEMEDHTTTDATLRIFARLCERFDNVGIVLQSRLFRTPDDIRALPEGRVSVRMVKGVYLEPAEIAHVDPDPIRDAYVAECRQLFERGAFVSFATHDAGLGQRLLELCRELGVGPDRYEFQTLLGVQERLWDEWRDGGSTVRAYVPYGPEWRAYSTRRLRKNPQMFRHVVRDLFARRK